MEIFKLISIVVNLMGAAAYCWMLLNNRKSNKQRAVNDAITQSEIMNTRVIMVDMLRTMAKMKDDHRKRSDDLTIAAMQLNDKFQELKKEGGVK